jgi:hypothetical protein
MEAKKQESDRRAKKATEGDAGSEEAGKCCKFFLTRTVRKVVKAKKRKNNRKART